MDLVILILKKLNPYAGRHLVLLLLVSILVSGLGGCAYPYSMSYHPLLDPEDNRLIKAKSIDHRWVKHMDQESVKMYRQGYAMVGYSYLVGGHLPIVAPISAKNFGGSLDAAQVLQWRNGSLYLATYWRAVREFSFGAYYEDAPVSAHQRIGGDVAVIVQDVVDGTPAHAAKLMPGDLLLALDDQIIPDAHWLDESIASKSGQDIILTIWPMLAMEPVNIKFTLAESSNP
ncbi:hypothetical protein ACTRXD_12745 [Nitrospira sp. T9]|uniref:hypothetical protein n=1 Tax=unclassified Nitrospira TaxID=2652172 RepID=UPI003F972562